MTVEIIYDQSPRKYGTGPGSNSQPLDLQSDSHLLPDTLPTALRGLVMMMMMMILMMMMMIMNLLIISELT